MDENKKFKVTVYNTYEKSKEAYDSRAAISAARFLFQTLDKEHIVMMIKEHKK